MAAKGSCPVCNFVNIPENSDTCPQCDSDLVCFSLLDALSDAPPTDEEENPSRTKQRVPMPARPIYMVSAGLACLLALALMLVLGYTANKRLAFMDKEIRETRTTLTRITTAVEKNHTVIRETTLAVRELRHHLQKTVTTQQAPPAPPQNFVPQNPVPQNPVPPRQPTCFKQYQAKDTDTLWDISRTLYGSGLFYPVLMAHNPGLEIYNISSRDTLRYLCDKKAVPQMYKKITATAHGKRYWKYKIKPRDTRRSVIRRYCPNKTNCLVEDLPFTPGTTIGIYLE